MLSGELYETLTRSRNDVLVCLIPESRIYGAHFPGHPVTPGVTLVQIAVELLSEQEGKPLEIVAAKNIKFLIPVMPGTMLRYRFAASGTDGWDVSVFRQDDLCARMNLTVK